LNRELSGTISIVQPDGRTEYWTFSNSTGSFFGEGFNGNPTLTAGIGVTESAKPGDYYPTAIFARNNWGQDSRKSAIEVVWNVRQLTVEPRLASVKWYCEESYSREVRGEGFAGVYSYQYQTDITPAANGGRTFIPLPNAAGPGLSPILPATFSGTIIVDGVSLSVTAGNPTSPTTLQFNGEFEGLVNGYRYWEYGRWQRYELDAHHSAAGC
jgi:hypothetical protein